MNKDGQPFRSSADHARIAKGYQPKPASARRGYRHAVPQIQIEQPRLVEREFKRRRREGIIPIEQAYRPVIDHGRLALGQTGHRPNHSRNTEGPHRNSIWPASREGR